MLKEFADDNFKYDENGGKLFIKVETLLEKEKLLITSNFSYSHSFFKRFILQTPKTKGLFGKGKGLIFFSPSMAQALMKQLHAFAMTSIVG